MIHRHPIAALLLAGALTSAAACSRDTPATAQPTNTAQTTQSSGGTGMGGYDNPVPEAQPYGTPPNAGAIGTGYNDGANVPSAGTGSSSSWNTGAGSTGTMGAGPSTMGGTGTAPGATGSGTTTSDPTNPGPTDITRPSGVTGSSGTDTSGTSTTSTTAPRRRNRTGTPGGTR